MSSNNIGLILFSHPQKKNKEECTLVEHLNYKNLCALEVHLIILFSPFLTCYNNDI